MSALYESLITVTPLTFVAQICNLLIQMYLVKRFLLDKVRAVLAARKAAADEQIAAAKQARAEAETLKTEYEQNMAQAKAQAGEIVLSAQKTAAARSEQLLGEAKTQADQLRRKAESDIALEKKKAVNDLKNEIGGIAMEIATKVVEREIHEEDHRELIDEFIRNVGDAS